MDQDDEYKTEEKNTFNTIFWIWTIQKRNELRLPKKNMVLYFIYETDIIIFVVFFPFCDTNTRKMRNIKIKKMSTIATEPKSKNKNWKKKNKWIIMVIVCWA